MVNTQPLPRITKEYGLQTPTERFMQMNNDFQLNEDIYHESIQAALSSRDHEFPPPAKIARVEKKIRIDRPMESSSTIRMSLPRPIQQPSPMAVINVQQIQQQAVQVVGQNYAETSFQQQETQMIQAFKQESNPTDDFGFD